MGLPHGGKADVYSWALLAWSVVAVRPPFEGIGRSSFFERVVVRPCRYTYRTSAQCARSLCGIQQHKIVSNRELRFRPFVAG